MATPVPTALFNQIKATVQNLQATLATLTTISGMIQAESTLSADLAAAATAGGRPDLVQADFDNLNTAITLVNTLLTTNTGNNVAVTINTGGHVSLAFNRMVYS